MSQTIEFSPSQYDALRNEFEASCENARVKMIEYCERANYIIDNLPDLFSTLGSAILDSWRRDIAEAMEAFEFLFDLVGAIYMAPTAPLDIFAYSWQWGQIAQHTKDLYGIIHEQNLVSSDSDWSGEAHDAYTEKAAEQLLAINAIMEISNGMMLNCIALAVSGAVLLAGLLGGILGLVVSIEAAIAALATPAAPASPGIAIAGIISSGLVIDGVILAFAGDLLIQSTTIRALLDRPEPLPNDTWPTI